jgi:N-acetylglucosaminyldiphosphoundecaprenol N-acetyl-beta-D-mannosaminyltransferase
MGQTNSSNIFSVLGTNISSFSQKEFLATVDTHLKHKAECKPMFIVTVNPEIIIQSLIDQEYKNILSNASINTADGTGICWAIHFLYGAHVDRITGSDSTEKICELCAKNDSSVFFYGAMPGIAANAAEVLKSRISGLCVTGTYSPESSEINVDELPETEKRQIKQASAIFVALGAPSQEKWIHRNLPMLPNCKLIIGIGGTFDFITGNIKRAPVFFQKTGFEWLYRLYLQPSRWRRMLKLPLFVMNILFLKSSISDLQSHSHH